MMRKCVEQLWVQYDTDGNGYLDRNETMRFVRDSMKEMGVSLEKLTDEDFEATFSEFDKDNSGTVEKQEMVAYMKKLVGLE